MFPSKWVTKYSTLLKYHNFSPESGHRSTVCGDIFTIRSITRNSISFVPFNMCHNSTLLVYHNLSPESGHGSTICGDIFTIFSIINNSLSCVSFKMGHKVSNTPSISQSLP